MKVTMSISPSVYCFVLFILFDVAVKSHISSNSNTHTLPQGTNEVRYIVDGIQVNIQEFSSNNKEIKNGDDVVSDGNLHSYFKFVPPILDFKERPLGVPHQEKVYIINKNANRTFHLSSISGNTNHFHSSFFDSKILAPLGNTSFNVVFLGREVGEVESILFIHMTEGSFKYEVRGTSVQSPYRLRPLSGVRLPLNASFSPIIKMHNPYPTPLQLVEVYSSGGDFHLELPTGELEGPKKLWEIPAFLTKPVIRVRFHADTQKNHTAYIRLKVNNSEEVLVVPLEVEVGPSCGLYTAADVVDFGIGGSLDPPTTRHLKLHNSWKKPIKIQNVISTPVSKALKIVFQPVTIPPETEDPVNVAQLTFDWAAALEAGHTGGRIVVKSKQSTQKLVIPYTATVLAGGLSYERVVTRFRSNYLNDPPRNFYVTNNFKIPIAITNVSLQRNAQRYFEVSHFEPQILQPADTQTIFQIHPSPSAKPSLRLVSTVLISTNVSTLSVPLLCFDGKLKMVMSDRKEAELELGTVGSGTEKHMVFSLMNENPVPVNITQWSTSLPFTSVSLVAIQDNYELWMESLHKNVTKGSLVGVKQYAVMRVSVSAGAQVGDYHGEVRLTSEYQNMFIPAHMRVEHGSLQVTPDPVVFKDCFPGKVCMEVLRVQSLFSIAMALTKVSGDSRLSFTPMAPPLVPPAATTALGMLTFDTRLLPPEDNYLATTHNLTGGTRWQDTLDLPAHCPDYDLSLMRARYDHFTNLSARLLNLTLRLDTTEVREHMFGARVRLSWPQLAKDLTFPLTQVGNTSHRVLVIHNPGTQQPIMVQLVNEPKYPASASLRARLQGDSALGMPGGFVVDVGSSQYREVGSHIHRDTWAFLLPPMTNTTVLVYFTPTDAHFFSTMLLIRNNLTVLESVELSGVGAYAQFQFNVSRGETDHTFNLDKAINPKTCYKERDKKAPGPIVTMTKTFRADNTGPLSIFVHGYFINGHKCEGYGFRVINCNQFLLPPNSSRKVEIAFTPDFTLTKVQRTLNIHTTAGATNFTLEAEVSLGLLSNCSSVLERPLWEPLLYYSAVSFMTFLLICVLAAAYLDSSGVLKSTQLGVPQDTSLQPVLDLKTIGTGVGMASSATPAAPEPPVVKTPPKQFTPPSVSHAPSSPESEGEKEKVGEASTSPQSKCHQQREAKRLSDPSSWAPATGTTQVGKEAVEEASTSPQAKCHRRRVAKRLSDPTGTQRRNSWASDFSKSVTSLPKAQQAKPTALISPELSKLPLTDNRRKLPKKLPSLGRCLREVAAPPPPCHNSSMGEDTETSSTTTESSHDDGDKEVEVTMALREPTIHKPVRVRTQHPMPLERNAGSTSSHEWEDDEPTDKEPLIKKHNNIRNRKNNSKISKTSESGQSSQTSGRVKGNNTNKQGNSRNKEKQILAQKRSSEKLVLPMPKPVVLEPPPPPLGLWDESRASFSDVVARSDTTKHSYAQTTPTPPALLGPIGSKKTYPSVWDHWSDSSELVTTPAPPTSSFFMDTRPPPVVQAPTMDNWGEQNMVFKLMQQAEEQRRLEIKQAEELKQKQQQQQQQQQHRPIYNDAWSPWSPTTPTANSSLWGSDVWAPPPPPNTWAPPGFAPRPARRREEPDNADVGLNYDLFRSMSDIWAPPSNNWNNPENPHHKK